VYFITNALDIYLELNVGSIDVPMVCVSGKLKSRSAHKVLVLDAAGDLHVAVAAHRAVVEVGRSP